MKAIWCYGVAGILALAGCQSGMYSSNVSVEKNNAGVSDYTVVNSLDVTELSQSMPVIVESKPTHEKGAHGLNNLLWLVTLGIVPGVSSEAMTYDVTVKTPLGEKSGTCKIEASSWMGWLPIFIPYPGMAEERTANPKLPNADIEGKVRDKLVSNLVSQFPRDEYARLVAKNNSPELKAQRAKEAAERERLAKERAEAERVRLAKEAAERAEKERLAMRTALYEKTVEHDLAAIRKIYARGRKYGCPFPRKTRCDDWLKTWTDSRLELSEEDKLAGEALLSGFGAKYMPKAFAHFERTRDVAKELQQVFNEEFPEPWKINSASVKWKAFNKMLEKLAKVRTEYFMSHDELCHYWNSLKLGAMTSAEVLDADDELLGAHLMPENFERVGYSPLEYAQLEPEPADFAGKYAPETYSLYQQLEREYKANIALMMETSAQRKQMDDVRYDRSFHAVVQKNNELVRKMKMLSSCLLEWHTDHRITEKSSEDVAKLDHKLAMEMKPFVESLPAFIPTYVAGPIIPKDDIVCLPVSSVVVNGLENQPNGALNHVEKRLPVDCSMMRFEVTQFQWMLVMGYNPSEFLGPDRPVDNVEWKSCLEFVKRINQMDGQRYRVPYIHEWQYACLAGGDGKKCGLRVNGESGPLRVMGCYRGNRQNKGTVPVGSYESNAWGVYDMHGNVREWGKPFFYTGGIGDEGTWAPYGLGGSWNSDEEDCYAFYSWSGAAGLRLVVPGKTAVEDNLK